jgi:hypothetical protein
VERKSIRVSKNAEEASNHVVKIKKKAKEASVMLKKKQKV